MICSGGRADVGDALHRHVLLRGEFEGAAWRKKSQNPVGRMSVRMRFGKRQRTEVWLRRDEITSGVCGALIVIVKCSMIRVPRGDYIIYSVYV